MGARDDTLIDFARELVERLGDTGTDRRAAASKTLWPNQEPSLAGSCREVERELLLRRFPPKYENVVADHVTLRVGATPDTPLPHKPQARAVVGRADDGRSLECLVVELDGTTDRPDGSTYHITWSLGPAPQGAREQRCAARSRLGAISRRRSPWTWSRRAFERATAVPRCRRRARRFRRGRAAAARDEPARISKRSTAAALLEAARERREFLWHAARNARCAAAVRRRRASRADDPHRAAARAVGPRRRRSNGRPSISRACRSSPAWRATSTSI